VRGGHLGGPARGRVSGRVMVATAAMSKCSCAQLGCLAKEAVNATSTSLVSAAVGASVGAAEGSAVGAEEGMGLGSSPTPPSVGVGSAVGAGVNAMEKLAPMEKETVGAGLHAQLLVGRGVGVSP